MLDTIISALLPVVITLCLGFMAGWHHDFESSQGSILNRMVMLYALPLSLFSSMMGMQREALLAQLPMGILFFVGMIGGYAIVFLISRFVFKRSSKAAALQALAISGPAVPFIGVPVLGFLFGETSAVPIAMCSIIMNLVQNPITLFILSHDDTQENDHVFLKKIINTLKEPVVWAPLLAFVLLMLNVRFPAPIISSFKLLGGTTGGVALFSSGIILYSYKISLTKSVIASVLTKNIIIPLAILAIGSMLHMSSSITDIAVITMAIPSASICVILAVQYKTCEKEMASTLFLSTILSVITMGAFLFFIK